MIGFGKLEIHFDEAPRKALIYWSLSFSGDLELIAPKEIRSEVKKMTEKLFEEASVNHKKIKHWITPMVFSLHLDDTSITISSLKLEVKASFH